MPDLIRSEMATAGGADDHRAAKNAGKKFEWKLLFGDHHESHAASAFYPSPFEEAAILTIDGVGEWATSSLGIGRGNEITLMKELRFPDSLGLLYSCLHLLHRFQSKQRRVQSDGSRAVWRTKVRQLDKRQYRRSS